ncbi:MAG: hypothetical protein ACI9KE_004857 [Polyangiales bacterium]|jgi:hypothetical protein
MRFSLVALMLALGLGGCVDDNVSVFILRNIAPEIEDDGCSFSPDSNAAITQGRWDISGSQRYAGNYIVTVAVVNQIQARASTVASEPNGVQISGAEVTLRDLAGDPIAFGGLPNPFSVPASVYIAPADGPDSTSASAVSIVAVPRDYGASLMAAGTVDTTIVASLRLVGQTNGQIDIRTGEWDFPIAICTDCLFGCPPAGEPAILSCNPGQDFVSLDPSTPGCM